MRRNAQAARMRDTLSIDLRMRLEDDDPYLNQVRSYWNDSLRAVLNSLPAPAWMTPRA